MSQNVLLLLRQGVDDASIQDVYARWEEIAGFTKRALRKNGLREDSFICINWIPEPSVSTLENIKNYLNKDVHGKFSLVVFIDDGRQAENQASLLVAKISDSEDSVEIEAFVEKTSIDLSYVGNQIDADTALRSALAKAIAELIEKLSKNTIQTDPT